MASTPGSGNRAARRDFGPANDLLTDAMSAGLARNWWVIALRGGFAILFGIVAIVMPGVAIASLVLLFAAYMLADGFLAVVAGVRAARHGERWGWLIFEGAANILVSAVALFWPGFTVLFFVSLISAWAIVTGAMLIPAAFRLRVDHGRWLMVFGGFVSVIWGILLLARPFVGALVLTWWMGGYALFFGGALIALAFRLRQHRQELPGGTVTKPA